VKSILAIVPLLMMVIFVPTIYAAYVKLSARLLRYQRVSLKHGFAFGFAMTILSIIGRATTFSFGYTLPIAIGVILAFAVNLLIGGWFFSKRAAYSNGRALGWRGGMQLAGLTFVFFGLTGVIGVMLVGVLRALMVQSVS
jgi:hypothetical protein